MSTTPAVAVPPVMAVIGSLGALTGEQEARLLDRGRATDRAVERAVAAVVASVRARGDAALRELASRFDGVELAAFEVPRARWEESLRALPAAVRDGLGQAAGAIERFHRAQLPAALEIEVRPGVRVGRRADPLRRIGVYVPGGRAAYPSSVLMGVVPARVAGVEEVIVCSPPGPGGEPPGPVLAACALAGVDRLFALGGAGAVAAMALGTASVPRVDKVVGPGNAYVTEAKRQLAAVVAVDAPAGPSEVLIVADATASAELVAAELMAQAEHDPDAAVVLVSTDADLPARVLAALARLLADQPRRQIVETALAARGGLLVADSLAAALAFAERYAPEHLALLVADPRAALAAVRCAGTVVLGAPSSVTFGDYVTGANHVLPTAGLARGASGLSTTDFLRWTTYQEVTPAAAAELAVVTAALATAEGLPAHALAASLRAAAGDAPPPHAGAVPWSSPPARAGYRELARYDPGRLPCAVDLSDNTNLAGPPPAVARLLAGVAREAVTRYPSPYAADLRSALAERVGVGVENVTTGCGSDDLIDAAIRAFCEPGAGVAFPTPTFGILAAFARANGAVPVGVALGGDLALEPEPLIATGAAVTYLCRPNNPTGTLFAREDVERVAAGSPGLLLVDEAYADFAGEDLRGWAAASRNVVVLRTLSKAWGLAGLRVGYAVGPAALIHEIDKARGPYKVGGVAAAAALAALAADDAWCGAGVREVVANRQRLAAELAARGLVPLPSAANFLFVPLPAKLGGARALAASLRGYGVAVRPFADLPAVGDGIRVGIGPWPLMTRFLSALDAVRPQA